MDDDPLEGGHGRRHEDGTPHWSPVNIDPYILRLDGLHPFDRVIVVEQEAS